MKILIDESVLQLALDTLVTLDKFTYCQDHEESITVLRSALQAADNVDPVAFVHGKPDEPWDCLQWFPDEYSSVPLYDLRGIKE